MKMKCMRYWVGKVFSQLKYYKCQIYCKSKIRNEESKIYTIIDDNEEKGFYGIINNEKIKLDILQKVVKYK